MELNLDFNVTPKQKKRKQPKKKLPSLDALAKGASVKPRVARQPNTSKSISETQKLDPKPQYRQNNQKSQNPAPKHPNTQTQTQRPQKRSREDSNDKTDGANETSQAKRPKLSQPQSKQPQELKPHQPKQRKKEDVEKSTEFEPKKSKVKKPKTEVVPAKPLVSYDEVLKLYAEEKKYSVPITVETVAEEVFTEASWDSLDLHERLVKVLKEGTPFSKPTAVQSKAIPQIFSGKDVLVKAETGSGKTLAYLLPILSKLLDMTVDRNEGTYALVIAPTRELCLQIFEVLQKLVRPFPWLVPGYIIGGEKKQSEKARLRKGIPILVSTPGRLLDHLNNTSSFNLQRLALLVLDEADRLLDMGFERDLRQIIEKLSEKSEKEKEERQNILVSATLNKEVNKLALLSLNEPVFVGLNKDGEDEAEIEEDGEDVFGTSIQLPSGLKQYYMVSHPKRKLVHLLSFLIAKTNSTHAQATSAKKRHGPVSAEVFSHDPNWKGIIFVSNCDSVEFLHTLFSATQLPDKLPDVAKHQTVRETSLAISVPIFKLHGNLSQTARTATYLAFRDSPSGLIICTDVAARGLDLPLVNWIIQYDAPSDPNSYIHRIGRTARIGTKGEALLFLMPSEVGYVDILMGKKMTFDVLQSEKLMARIRTNLERNPTGNGVIEEGCLQYQIHKIIKDEKDIDFEGLAIKAFQAFLRSYATHVRATKHIFHIKNLHLGHVAKSFGLNEIPSLLQGVLDKKQREEEKKQKKDKTTMRNDQRGKKAFKAKFNHVSEFADGL